MSVVVVSVVVVSVVVVNVVVVSVVVERRVGAAVWIRHACRVPSPRSLLFALRLLWLVAPATVGQALVHAVDSWGGSAAAVISIAGWIVWGLGLVAVLVPSAAGLTVLRTLAGLPVLATIWAVASGNLAVWQSGLAAVGAVAIVLVAFLGEIGQHFVQASAYGDESRFPLRPPRVLSAVMVVLWLVAALAATLGFIRLASGREVSGVLVGAAGVGLLTLVGHRGHRFARRWLVFVPAGVVVHDQVVLAETLMCRSANVAGVFVAPTDSQAADATGGVSGARLTLAMRDSATVVFAADRSNPRGRAIHAYSIDIAPTRPGAALAASPHRSTIG